MTRRLIAIIPVLLAAAVAAHAEDKNTVLVRGRGTVRVRPDRLILVLGATGKAEKATDAVEKLGKKTGEIKDAVNLVLKDKQGIDAAVRDSGLSFGAPAGNDVQIMMGGGNQDAASEIAVSTDLEVTVTGVDKMKDSDLAALVSGLLDKAVEAGAEVKPPVNRFNPWMNQGGGVGVYFGFSDYNAQVEKAWDEAAKKAKERAASIAKRLDLVIGDAVKVRDVSGEDGAQKAASNPYAALMGMATGEDGPKIKSSGEIELSVEIEVEFELKKK